MITIGYIRKTGLITDAEAEAYVAAQQVQIDRDYGPRWGLSPGVVKCVYAGKNASPTGYTYVMYLIDHSADAGDLGYHTDDGQPAGYIAVGDDIEAGSPWSITGSHETLETLGDANCGNTVRVVFDGVTYEYAYENCDAIEDDPFAYDINGIAMSAFVLPAWFIQGCSGPYTFPPYKEISAPFMLASGGYASRREIAPTLTDWDQNLAPGKRGRRTYKGQHSRTVRRGVAPSKP